MKIIEILKGIFLKKKMVALPEPEMPMEHTRQTMSEYEIQKLQEQGAIYDSLRASDDPFLYKKVMETFKQYCDERGVEYSSSSTEVFQNLISNIQSEYDQETKEPCDYKKVLREYESYEEYGNTENEEWSLDGSDDYKKIWHHMYDFDFLELGMNPDKLNDYCRKKISECYEQLGEYSFGNIGEMTYIIKEFAQLISEFRSNYENKLQQISNIYVSGKESIANITNEELRECYETLIASQKIQELLSNFDWQFKKNWDMTEKLKMAKYEKSAKFMSELEQIMAHDKGEHIYHYHGTQFVEDSSKIIEEGFLMYRDNLSSTSYQEFSEKDLLLYSRRIRWRCWTRFCGNNRSTGNRWSAC